MEIARYYNYPDDAETEFAFDRIGTHPLEIEHIQIKHLPQHLILSQGLTYNVY